MGILKVKLLEPGARSSVVGDCVQLVDSEVSAEFNFLHASHPSESEHTTKQNE